MLEKLPSLIGRGLRAVRPGMDRIVSSRAGVRDAPMSIILESPTFATKDSIPRRFTADGDGLRSSPPLRWSNVPDEAQTLVLIVEDADSPTPQPLVHAIVTGLAATRNQIAENELVAAASNLALGKNSYLKVGWMPPDPPPGHGPHRYVFQLFALDHVPEIGDRPGRSAVVNAVAGHTLARGLLVGTYTR